jgi:DNA-binding NarL/FixJ family response regulator
MLSLSLKGNTAWDVVSEFEVDGCRYAVLATNDAPPPFTPREQEVLTRACRGETNKVIAYELGISDSTVRVLMGRVCAKLGVRSRCEAIEASGLRSP